MILACRGFEAYFDADLPWPPIGLVVASFWQTVTVSAMSLAVLIT